MNRCPACELFAPACGRVAARAYAGLLASVLHALAMLLRLLIDYSTYEARSRLRSCHGINATTNSTLASRHLRGCRCRLGRRRVAGLPAPPEAGRTDDLPAGERDGSLTGYGALPLRDAATAQLDADGARAGRRRGEHPAALHARRRERHVF